MRRRRFPATSSTPLSSPEMLAQMYVLSAIWDDLRYPFACASCSISLSVDTKLFPFFRSLFHLLFVYLLWSSSVVITSCLGVYDMPLLVLCSLPRLSLSCRTESVSNATTRSISRTECMHRLIHPHPSTSAAGPSSICIRTRTICTHAHLYDLIHQLQAGRNLLQTRAFTHIRVSPAHKPGKSAYIAQHLINVHICAPIIPQPPSQSPAAAVPSSPHTRTPAGMH